MSIELLSGKEAFEPQPNEKRSRLSRIFRWLNQTGRYEETVPERLREIIDTYNLPKPTRYIGPPPENYKDDVQVEDHGDVIIFRG